HREHEAVREVVVAAAVDEADCGELGARELLLGRLAGERRAAGGKAEPEVLAGRLAEATALEVRAHRLARGGVPEIALVERGRLLEEGVEAVAVTSLLVGLG